MKYQMTQTETGMDMGTYEADSPEEALIAMHIDAGAAPDTASDEGLVVVEVQSITTTITVDGEWGSTSNTATDEDPCAGHLGEYPSGVYDALDDEWDGERATVVVGGCVYTMTSESSTGDDEIDSDGDCIRCGHPANGSSGHGTCNGPAHR